MKLAKLSIATNRGKALLDKRENTERVGFEPTLGVTLKQISRVKLFKTPRFIKTFDDFKIDWLNFGLHP